MEFSEKLSPKFSLNNNGGKRNVKAKNKKKKEKIQTEKKFS